VCNINDVESLVRVIQRLMNLVTQSPLKSGQNLKFKFQMVDYIKEKRGNYFFQNPVKMIITQSIIRDGRKPWCQKTTRKPILYNHIYKLCFMTLSSASVVRINNNKQLNYCGTFDNIRSLFFVQISYVGL